MHARTHKHTYLDKPNFTTVYPNVPCWFQNSLSTNIVAVCVGKFEETRDKGADSLGYDSSSDSTLADCQQSCIADAPYCKSVDYKDGICIRFDTVDKLVENVGNINSLLKPCTTR